MKICKYCGLENKQSHHCSGKKAYEKGKKDLYNYLIEGYKKPIIIIHEKEEMK